MALHDERSSLLSTCNEDNSCHFMNRGGHHSTMENGSTGPPSSPYGAKSNFIQFGLCIIASIAQLSAGMSLGFSAVTLPYMQQEGSYMQVTSDQASWIASIAAITIPFGCLVSGPVLDRWGRKVGLLLVNLPSLIGWLLIAINPDLIRLYIGRGLTGFGGGLASVPATVYFAEVSTKSMRGLLISGTSIAIGVGVLIVYVLGYFLKADWRMIAFICAAFPVTATLLIAIFLPESPLWLISKGRDRKACNSLQYIRGVSTSKDVQEEINTMLEQYKSNRKDKLTVKEMITSFLYPEVYKPFFIMVMYFLFQQFSGIFVIIFYAVDVVQNSGITADPYLVSIALGLVRVIFTLIAAWMSKQFGRRPPSIISGIGMTISLFAMIFHLYWESHVTPKRNSHANETSDLNTTLTEVTTTASTVSWLPLFSILFYVLFSTIGFLTLPWAIIGEVFPSRVRGVAGGLTTCLAYIASFITVKSYPYLLHVLQQIGIYIIFGIVSLIGTVFVIIWLPETQGKTLQEIEQYFSKRDARREFSDGITSAHEEKKIMLSVVTKPIIQPKLSSA